jgi:hypothetical protein
VQNTAEPEVHGGERGRVIRRACDRRVNR